MIAPRLSAAAGLLALAGCVEDGPPRDPTPLPGPPLASAAPATALTLVAGSAFEDSDRNGWRDSLIVLAYLFAPSSDYPLSLEREGRFTFRLLDAQQKPLAAWTFDRAAAAAALKRDLPPGPGYVFTLDLRAVGREAQQAHEGWIEAEFAPEPAGAGEPLRRSSQGAVAVGSAR